MAKPVGGWHNAPTAHHRREARLRKVAREHWAVFAAIITASIGAGAALIGAPKTITGVCVIVALLIIVITDHFSRR